MFASLTAIACGKADAPPPRPPVPVMVAEARREAAPLEVSAVGMVEAKSTVEVRSRVGGEVMRVHFQEGDEVHCGDVLFTMDPRPFQTALAEAQALLARDRVLADNAARQAARYAELVQKDFVTKEQYDAAEAEARSQKANLAADEAVVADARLQLDYATIRAPLEGRAGALVVHTGSNVKANDQTMVVLHQMAPIDVRFPVPQQQLNEVRSRAAAGRLSVLARDSGGAARFGHLSFVDNAIDPETGTIQLKASFDNADRALWPGQLVQVALKLGEEQAVVAPEAAVQSGQQGDYVFVVKADQTVESRPVKVARTLGDRVVIAEGLTGGETVVTDGQLRLVPGAKVTIKRTPPSPQSALPPSAGSEVARGRAGAPPAPGGAS
ncbi:MAG TPA: efflux RND transporter periplasmic adaptor subunit [Thermoanaerobaculia bacterium]|nr:efflux RND transporter periplasmic adaptor subunit [Thermoanaerobaculia bacterium]